MQGCTLIYFRLRRKGFWLLSDRAVVHPLRREGRGQIFSNHKVMYVILSSESGIAEWFDELC